MKITALVIIDAVLLLFVLFKHYIIKEFFIMGFITQVIIFPINILYNILFIKQGNGKKYLPIFIIPIIFMVLTVGNIDAKIALKIELSKAKEKLEKNSESYDNVFQDDNIYAFVYISGVLDNWVAIVYDDSGLLEYGIEIINRNGNYMTEKK